MGAEKVWDAAWFTLGWVTWREKGEAKEPRAHSRGSEPWRLLG